jgi:hypothetical protein
MADIDQVINTQLFLFIDAGLNSFNKRFHLVLAISGFLIGWLFQVPETTAKHASLFSPRLADQVKAKRRIAMGRLRGLEEGMAKLCPCKNAVMTL